jgi:hypothetical protein
MALPHTPPNKPESLHFRDRRVSFREQKHGCDSLNRAYGRFLIGDFRGAAAILARFCAALIFAADQQGGNRMLEDELFLGLGLKQDGILVKRAHAA